MAASGGDLQRLDPRVQVLWVVRAVVVALVLGALVTIAERAVLGTAVWLGPSTALVVGALGVAFAVLRYRSWGYRLRTDALYLERGVLTRVQTIVPYVRVQHVDTREGPVERLAGLATVVVYTAGSRGADVSVPGLVASRATDLRERLERLTTAAESEDAV
ncbi:MAG: PH domain-containing protein [Haloarculaceae archaeon]